MSNFSGLFEDHLGVDAVVAYVDGELSLTAFQRAAAHLSRCPSCATEVAEQSSARQSLRSACSPAMPPALLASLSSIPLAVPPAARPAGVGIDPRTGSAIRISTSGRDVGRRGRFRFGAGALMAGIAVGAFASAGPGSDSVPTPSEPPSGQVIPVNAPVSLPFPAPAVGNPATR
jgi:anti-sigma factor RsiW